MVSWFKKIYIKENSIKGATILLMVTLVLSNLLGVIRDHFLAKHISTYYLDIYYAGFKLPDLMFNVLILSAVSSVFIPIFTEKISQKESKRGFELANNLLLAGVFFTTISAVILYFLLPFLIPLLVPKFSQDRINLTVSVSRILSITPIFFSISYALSGILNSYKRFFAYSIAPLFYNCAIIFGAVFLSGKYGVTGIAWSVVVGSFFHFLIQLPAARRTGLKISFTQFWKDRDLKRIIKLMIPRSIGLGTNQITAIAFTTIASALAAGSIAVYNFADNIQTMPVVVFGTSLATVLFPTLSEQAALQNKDIFIKYFSRAFKVITYTMIPSSIFLYLFSNQIIRLILGSGKFNISDTARASDTLGAFALAILFESLLTLVVRAYFAQKNTRIPMNASLVSMVIGISAGYIFSRYLGVAGLALGIALGNMFSVIYLLIIFDKKFIKIDFSQFSTYILKVLFASLVAGAIAYVSLRITGEIFDLRRVVGTLMQTLISGVLGISALIIISYWLGIEEISLVYKGVSQRLGFNSQEKLSDIQ